MTFPSIVGHLGNGDTADGTTHAVTWPTVSGGILSTDMALIAYGIDGNPTTTLPDGSYVKLHDSANSTLTKLLVAYRRMVGGETGTFNIGTSVSEQGGWHVFIVRDVHATSAPECTAGAIGTSAAPDPAILTPSWGTAEDILWWTIHCRNGNADMTVAPTNYLNLTTDKSTGINNVAGGLGTARRTLNASSENPGASTISASTDWRAVTVGIRPLAAAAAVRPSQFNSPYMGRW